VDLADRYEPQGLARPLLALASMLDPNGMPDAVLTSAPARRLLCARERQDTLGPPYDAASLMLRMVLRLVEQPSPPPTEEQVRDALRTLHRLSLIDHSPGVPHRAVRVHALIQRATRDSLSPERHTDYARAAADALYAAWPDVERDTDLVQALRANTAVLTAHAEQGACLHRPRPHPVLTKAGWSLGESGQAEAARDHFQHLAEGIAHHLGSTHEDAFAARDHLAHWQGRSGDPAGAVRAYTALLEDRLRVLGPDHPDTLSTRSNLAFWQGRTRNAPGAVATYAKVVEDRLRTLGPDHPETLDARGNVAFWLGRAGDAEGAAAAYGALVDAMWRVLGPDHTQTLTARARFGHWQGRAGDKAGAVATFAALVQDLARVLGPEHPDTRSALNSLARWRKESRQPVSRWLIARVGRVRRSPRASQRFRWWWRWRRWWRR
jgi:hypothetical protein